MDWMTLCIVSMGLVIFCLWAVIPIGEFREIYRHLRARGVIGRQDSSQADRSTGEDA